MHPIMSFILPVLTRLISSTVTPRLPGPCVRADGRMSNHHHTSFHLDRWSPWPDIAICGHCLDIEYRDCFVVVVVLVVVFIVFLLVVVFILIKCVITYSSVALISLYSFDQ